jgi:NitT/TauT family transport system permease protein
VTSRSTVDSGAVASPATAPDASNPGADPAGAGRRDDTDGYGDGNGKGRGRPQSRLFELRGTLPTSYRLVLAVVGLAGIVGLWLLAASTLNGDSKIVPTPGETFGAFLDEMRSGNLWVDLKASGGRILYGYLISMAIGIVVGLAMGSLMSVEALVEAPIAFMRYVPATAMTPLLLVWLGIEETPKITLVVLGTVFFNILMIADVARAVPRELIEASYTLGARRRTVLRRVILRHSVPGIIDVGRINLAAAWLVLPISEVLAAQEGLAFRIDKAERLRGVDTMFALLIVFGVIGVVSDLALRWLRNASSPWAKA